MTNDEINKKYGKRFRVLGVRDQATETAGTYASFATAEEALAFAAVKGPEIDQGRGGCWVYDSKAREYVGEMFKSIAQ